MTAFFMAWSMFCYIPCPVQKWDERKKQEMLVWFPVIGLIIGVICFAAYKLAACFKLQYLGAAVLCVLPWTLSGFLHLDGFMDCADAVLSCRDKSRRLDILKDSHVGAFAVITLVVLVVLSFAAWSECIFHIRPAVLIFIPAATRAVSALCVLCCKPLSVSSYAAIHAEGIKRKYIAALIVILIAVLSLGILFGGVQGLSVSVAALCCFLCVRRVMGRLGGMSGDVSGCSICISELMGGIALCFL